MAGARDLIGNCENCVSDEKPTKSVSVSCWNGVNKLNPHILNLNNARNCVPSAANTVMRYAQGAIFNKYPAAPLGC
jgi:hypothetical protein